MWCTEEAGREWRGEPGEAAGPDEGGSGSRAQSRGPALGQGSRRLQQGARAPLCPAPPAVCWRPPWGRSVEAVPGPPGGLRAAGEGGQGVSSLRVLPVSSPPSRSSASPPCRPCPDKACSCSLALGAPARPGPPHTLPSPLQTPLALQTRASSVALSSWGCPTRKSFPQHVACVFWKVSSSVILHTFAHAHLPRSAGLGPGAHAGHRWRPGSGAPASQPRAASGRRAQTDLLHVVGLALLPGPGQSLGLRARHSGSAPRPGDCPVLWQARCLRRLQCPPHCGLPHAPVALALPAPGASVPGAAPPCVRRPATSCVAPAVSLRSVPSWVVS